jgi:hypothetical protein
MQHRRKHLKPYIDDEEKVADYDEAGHGVKVPECIPSSPHFKGV